MSQEMYLEIQNEIIRILEEKNCTVADAKDLLYNTAKEIMSLTTVRRAGDISCST